MPSITLTRQQLYDRAWTTPLDALAKELGLSGRGLGKVCDRHNIPVPPRGWWAKQTAGSGSNTVAACYPWRREVGQDANGSSRTARAGKFPAVVIGEPEARPLT